MSDSGIPQFQIAGMMRCGTTSLSSWLRHHPEVFIPAVKEVHYFDRFYDNGAEWYAHQFEGARPGQIVGDATPNYAYREDALNRLARDLPESRMVILLRDPVQRAHSHFLHNVARRRETLPFEDALDLEAERIASGDRAARDHFSYVDRGRYLRLLNGVYERFAAAQVRVVLFEDLRDSPRLAFQDVAMFLGIDPQRIPPEVGTQVNAYQGFRSLKLRTTAQRFPKPLRDAVGRLNRVEVDRYPDMEPATVHRLQTEFAGERAALARLLGRDLHEWQS